MGPQTSGKAHPKHLDGVPSAVCAEPIPPSLIDVALIPAKTCAAVGGMSLSWWYEEVAAGRAPKPAISEPRCARWTLVSVREFWVARAEAAASDATAAERVKKQSEKASAAATAKRAAKRAAAYTTSEGPGHAA
jgi:hypothetical protein